MSPEPASAPPRSSTVRDRGDIAGERIVGVGRRGGRPRRTPGRDDQGEPPQGAASADGRVADLHRRVNAWYIEHGRDLPWRRPECTPWGVFLSEVMSQQTPIARVEPAWHEWMARWPRPADLAADSPGEAVRLWRRLGYPRRALRLREAAVVMVERHGGAVPRDYDDLLALPGVGPYTAAAVHVFAFGGRATVVDTNVRRVQARAVTGEPLPAKALTRTESRLADDLLPEDDDAAVTWNVAVMELGALVCTARSPRCASCPVVELCAWQRAGAPAYDGPARRGQAWAGTDRQVRGRILQALRDAPGPVRRGDLTATWPDDPAKVDRCLSGLVTDGLVEPTGGDRFALPA